MEKTRAKKDLTYPLLQEREMEKIEAKIVLEV